MFESRDMIANISRYSLTEIINIATNHEVIFEQEQDATKDNSTLKSSFSTPPLIESSKEQWMGNKSKRDGEKKPWNCKNCVKEHLLGNMCSSEINPNKIFPFKIK